MGWIPGGALGGTDRDEDGEAMRATEKNAPPGEMRECWAGGVRAGDRREWGVQKQVWGCP
eukprot:5114570-Pyramimonas_sp.AAC.1